MIVLSLDIKTISELYGVGTSAIEEIKTALNNFNDPINQSGRSSPPSSFLPPELCEAPIPRSVFTPRTRNALSKDGIVTIGQLVDTYFHLTKIGQIGSKAQIAAFISNLLSNSDSIEAFNIPASPAPAASALLRPELYEVLIPSTALTPRIINALNKYGVQTIGELVDTDFSSENIPQIGTQARTDIADFINEVLHNPDAVQKIITQAQVHKPDVAVIPSDEIPHTSEGRPTLPLLLGSIVKALFIEPEKAHYYDILIRRYGAEGQRRYTLDELGLSMDRSRERVRQIEDKAIDHLHQFITKGKLRGVKAILHPAIETEISELMGILHQQPILIREDALWSLLNERYQISLTKSQQAFFRILLEAFGYRALDIQPPDVPKRFATAWLMQPKDKEEILRVAKAVVAVFRDRVEPISFFDLIIEVNRKRSGQRISREVLKSVLDLCPMVEAIGEETYRTTFAELSNYAQRAYRVLDDNGEPMDIQDITNKINHLLVKAGERATANVWSVAGQCVIDDRIVAVGRSMWSLAKWKRETRTIIDLIEDFLHAQAQPCTVRDITAYVQSKRSDAKKKTIWSLLADKTRFQRTDRATYGLNAWGVTPRQVVERKKISQQDFDASLRALFTERQTSELPLAEVARELSQRLSRGEQIIRVRIAQSSLTDVIGDPKHHYRVQLRDEPRLTTVGYNRKKKQPDIVQEAVRRILGAAVNREIDGSTLIKRLLKETNLPKGTIYIALKSMPDVERQGTHGKYIYRLRLQEDPPQLLSLPPMQDPVLAEQITHALKLLSVDFVHLSLLALATLFEDEVNSFLECASNLKLFTLPQKDLSKVHLVDKINILHQNHIIIDKALADYLRNWRNILAHNKPPSLTEREHMMRTAPALAGLFIHYSVMINDLRHISGCS